MDGPRWYVAVDGFVVATHVNEGTARYWYDLRVRVFGPDRVKMFRF